MTRRPFRKFRVLLIGGTSHTGKSTVAKRIAEMRGAICVSTDSLARHPGRPWPAAREVPAHVVRHYLELNDHALITSVLTHYRNMWPLLEALIRKHADDDADRLVLEGSAVLPENVAELRLPGVAAIWLTADKALLQARMYKESRYAERAAEGRVMIDKFLTRAVNFDQAILAAVRKRGLAHIEITEDMDVDTAAERCLAGLSKSL